MKRIFLTSALLLLSFSVFSQNLESFIKESRMQEDTAIERETRNVLRDIKAKDKPGFLKICSDRLKYIRDSRRAEGADIREYHQRREILMNNIHLAHDQVLLNPQEFEAYDERVRESLKAYGEQAAKCAELYDWDEYIQIIEVTPDPKTVYKVVIRKDK